MQEATTNTHETISKYTQLNVTSSRTVKVHMRHRSKTSKYEKSKFEREMKQSKKVAKSGKGRLYVDETVEQKADGARVVQAACN